MGEDYLPYISEALSLIAIGRLASRNAGRAIAVSCAPTFASKWLLPRLHGFKDQWPSLSINLDTSREQVGCRLNERRSASAAIVSSTV